MSRLAQINKTSLYNYEEDEDLPLSTIKAHILPPNPEIKRNGIKQNPRSNPNKLKSIQNGLQHAPSPLFQYQASNSDPSSNRSSSTYLGSGSHISSNRSSSTFQLNELSPNHRRSGRDTPLSESAFIEASQNPLNNINTKSKSTFDLTSGISLNKEEATKPSKKKGFSFFGLFKRNKKKEVLEETPESEPEVLQDTRTPAEIRAEEMKKMHDAEFAKLRRQREKEKVRSFYDMLPPSQQPQYDISPSRHAPSPQPSLGHPSMVYNNHSPQIMNNPSYYYSPPPSGPRIRSASTNNVSQYGQGQRPISSYNRGYSGGGYEPMQHGQRSSTYYANYSAGFASSETLSTQYSRNIAPSPLVPHQSPSRSSYYPPSSAQLHNNSSQQKYQFHQKSPNYTYRI